MLGQTNLYVNRSGTRPDKLLHCLYGKTCVIYRDAYIQVVRNTYAYTRIFFRQINRHDDFYTRVIRESCLLINELPLFSLKTNTFFFFFCSTVFVVRGKICTYLLWRFNQGSLLLACNLLSVIYIYIYIGVETKKMKLYSTDWRIKREKWPSAN